MSYDLAACRCPDHAGLLLRRFRYQGGAESDPVVPAAEPVVDKIVPLAKQYAPDQIASRIPEDTATLVRVDGALQIVGGLALATGKGRRLGAYLLAGSLVPNTIAKHPFWSRTDPEEEKLTIATPSSRTSACSGA